ncbi:unnamed protein product, partial [Rotaria socialis]
DAPITMPSQELELVGIGWIWNWSELVRIGFGIGSTLELV